MVRMVVAHWFVITIFGMVDQTWNCMTGKHYNMMDDDTKGAVTIMRCKRCNHTILDNGKFCPECGNELTCHDISVPVRDNNGQLFGVLSIVSAVIGVLVLPVILGPTGIIFGVVAVNKNNKLGWIGIVIGGIITLITGIALALISNE